jgi:hypothetical protein
VFILVVYFVIDSVRKLLDTLSYNNLVGKLEGKRPHGIHRRRWEDNNKMDLREVG